MADVAPVYAQPARTPSSQIRGFHELYSYTLEQVLQSSFSFRSIAAAVSAGTVLLRLVLLAATPETVALTACAAPPFVPCT
jgi:hypothetical protein